MLVNVDVANAIVILTSKRPPTSSLPYSNTVILGRWTGLLQKEVEAMRWDLPLYSACYKSTALITFVRIVYSFSPLFVENPVKSTSKGNDSTPAQYSTPSCQIRSFILSNNLSSLCILNPCLSLYYS